MIGVEPINVIHACYALSRSLRVSLYHMQRVNQLVDVLKAAVHAESTCRSIGMRGIPSQEDVLMVHFISQLRLQLPSTHVDDIQIWRNLSKVLIGYCCFDELLGSVN